jgi:hypothetical protein
MAELLDGARLLSDGGLAQMSLGHRNASTVEDFEAALDDMVEPRSFARVCTRKRSAWVSQNASACGVLNFEHERVVPLDLSHDPDQFVRLADPVDIRYRITGLLIYYAGNRS